MYFSTLFYIFKFINSIKKVIVLFFIHKIIPDFMNNSSDSVNIVIFIFINREIMIFILIIKFIYVYLGIFINLL